MQEDLGAKYEELLDNLKITNKLLYFVIMNGHVNTRGKPLDFRDMHYLRRIYDHFNHPHQVYMKSTQCGISELVLKSYMHYLMTEKGMILLVIELIN
jgi:hypothetical protein